MSFFGILKDIFFGAGIVHRRVTAETLSKIKYDWDKIKILLQEGKPSQLRQALMDADKCLDAALKDLVNGQSMGERLKNSRNLFDKDTYTKVWKAHRVRNAMVHEAGFEPNHIMLVRSVADLKHGLYVLGVRVDA